MEEQSVRQSIDEIQGKEITVYEASFAVCNESITLDLKIICNETKYNITFYNVSLLFADHISYPFVIQGFEITDNRKKWWQGDKRYYINDYEDGIFSFYCEDFYLWVG